MMGLTKDIFSFLSALSENNNKEWFSDNKKDYEKVKSIVNEFFKTIYSEIEKKAIGFCYISCLLYTSPSPRD